jgi:dihydrodipicolinate synthase/N-acetylneuraminate lyase
MTHPAGVAFFPVTPFDEESNVDEERLRQHVSSTVERGDFSSVVPLGSVGEFPYLTAAERRRVVDRVGNEGDGGLPQPSGGGRAGGSTTWPTPRLTTVSPSFRARQRSRRAKPSR